MRKSQQTRLLPTNPLLIAAPAETASWDLSPHWKLVRAFTNYTDSHVQSEQAAIDLCEVTNEILRKMVSVVDAMEKIGVSRPTQMSQLSEEVSRVNEVVTNLRGTEEETEVNNRETFYILPSADRRGKRRRRSDRNLKNVLATDEIDSPAK